MDLTSEQRYALSMADHTGLVMPSMAFPDCTVIKELKSLGLVEDNIIREEGMFNGCYWPKLTERGFKIRELVTS